MDVLMNMIIDVHHERRWLSPKQGTLCFVPIERKSLWTKRIVKSPSEIEHCFVVGKPTCPWWFHVGFLMVCADGTASSPPNYVAKNLQEISPKWCVLGMVPIRPTNPILVFSALQRVSALRSTCSPIKTSLSGHVTNDNDDLLGQRPEPNITTMRQMQTKSPPKEWFIQKFRDGGG